MGILRDGAVLIWFLAAATAVNGVVVTVFASQYIDLVAKKGLGKTETKNAYYSAIFVRGLSVVTVVFALLYVAWTFAESRHRVMKAKQQKLTAFSMKRLQESGLHAGTNHAKHRKKLTAIVAVLWLMWFVPVMLMAFQGWIYRHKEKEDGAEILMICPKNRREGTCEALFTTGVAAAFEDLWLLLALIVMIVTLMSSGVEQDLERQKIIDDLSNARAAGDARARELADVKAQLTAAQQQRDAANGQIGALQGQLADATNRANVADQHRIPVGTFGRYGAGRAPVPRYPLRPGNAPVGLPNRYPR